MQPLPALSVAVAAAVAAAVAVALPVPALAAPPVQAGTLSGAVATYRLSVQDTELGGGRFAETYVPALEVDGRSYRVSDPRLARLEPNSRVSIDGTLHGDSVALASVQPLQQPGAGVQAATTTDVVRTTRDLVILATWTTPDTMTQVDAQAYVADDDAWFKEVSYGREGISAVATPWVRIATPSTCTESDILARARAAAKALGPTYDSAAYDRTLVYFPKTTLCPWGGSSGIGADWSLYNGGYLSTSLTTHEQGHQLGLYHASSYDCRPQVMANWCDVGEYGDKYSSMGGGGPVHYNGQEKSHLGWLGSREVSLTDGGSATLAPLAQQTAAPQVARVTVSDFRSYTLEYRQPVGLDSYLSWNGTKGMDGVLVHVDDATGTGTGTGNSLLLDLSPDGDFYDSTLKSGRSWTTPEGWVIGVGALNASGAAVTVTAPARAPSRPGTPTATAGNGSATVSWTPPASTGGSPILDYTVTSYPDFREVTVPGSSLSATVTGLSNGTAYGFWVTARNSTGTSAQSDTSSEVTPRGVATVPGAPGTPTATAGNASATVTWPAPAWDGGSPVTGYTVTASPGGATATVNGSARTATVTGLTNGTPYTFTVKATNALGTSAASAASAPVTPGTRTTVQESALTLKGWSVLTDPAASGGSYRASSTAGDTATIAFSGTAATWLARGGPAAGKADVLIDGVRRGTVDLYRASPSALSFPYTGLKSGAHKLVVKSLGTRSAASQGAAVAVDGWQVGSTTVQDSATKVAYSGWTGAVRTTADGGAYRTSKTAGATASWTFTGTAVDWVTAVGPAFGRAEVLIDGSSRGTVDLYAATAQWKAVRSYGGLGSGTHTVTVKVLGTKSAASTGTAVVVDALRITS